MGFVEKVKNVISKLRAAGKTEKEVSEIIEQAAEAATVLKKTESPEQALRPCVCRTAASHQRNCLHDSFPAIPTASTPAAPDGRRPTGNITGNSTP